jgi:hypothetical protein
MTEGVDNMTTKTIKELLKGCRLIRDADGNVITQSINNMELAFLTTDDQFSLDDRFENPLSGIAMSNTGYGNVIMDNKTDKDIIVAPQVAVMTSYAAQNHAMIKSAFIRANSQSKYDDAGCVQGSQGGTIRAGRGNKIRFMPVSVREMLLQEVNKSGGFQRTYPIVKELGRRTATRTNEYLDRYFNKYDDKTVEFVAHFERPPKCIGVIVFINDEIVAVDKFPSFRYCAQVWDLLIRDCYGSLAIESMTRNESHGKLFSAAMDTIDQADGEPVVAYLERVLASVSLERNITVNIRLSELLAVDFTMEKDVQDGVYESHVLKSSGYLGQVIASQDYYHLVSLVKRDSFKPETMRDAIKAAAEYKEMAESQRAFAL